MTSYQTGTSRILQEMWRQSTSVGPVWLPRITVGLRVGQGNYFAYRAMIDTGSYFTLASLEVARELKINPVESTRAVSVSGLGGRAKGYLSTVDIELGLMSGGPTILLRSSRIVFVSGLTHYKVVIGQHDALERLIFIQRSQSPTPSFVIRSAE